jgi:DNA topoisomerase IA
MVYGSLQYHKTNFSTSTWQVQRTIKSSSFNTRRTCLSAECGIITYYRTDTAHFIATICAESKKDGEVTTTQAYKQNVHGFKFQVATIHLEQGLPWGSSSLQTSKAVKKSKSFSKTACQI